MIFLFTFTAICLHYLKYNIVSGEENLSNTPYNSNINLFLLKGMYFMHWILNYLGKKNYNHKTYPNVIQDVWFVDFVSNVCQKPIPKNIRLLFPVWFEEVAHFSMSQSANLLVFYFLGGILWYNLVFLGSRTGYMQNYIHFEGQFLQPCNL